MAPERPRVVIIGGGFGGLRVAQELDGAPVEVTLLDRRNFHLFQPLLYQVATGALSPANIAAPLRSLLRRQKNTRVLLAEVSGIDVANRQVLLDGANLATASAQGPGETQTNRQASATTRVDYSTLVVATGVWHQYFGHDEWEEFAPGLKTIEDATEMRRRILRAFENAEREADPDLRRAWLTFVVVGGGPTGVELAGAVGELAHHTLRNDFRSINPADARILLIEGLDRVLPPFPPKLSAKAAEALARLGVTALTGAIVTAVRPDGVTVRHGSEVKEIRTRTVLWAAGVSASPLGKVLADATGAALDRAGRVRVQPDLTLPGHPEIFVIGDLASLNGPDGTPLPGVAQVAIQQGKYVARLIDAREHGRPLPPFRYKDFGNMATIGRNAAVADLKWVYLSGWIGWLAWLFIHVMNIDQFHNRLLVLVQWAWSYFTRNRAARLITKDGCVLPPHRHG